MNIFENLHLERGTLPLYQQLFNYIRRAIIQNKIKSGDKLPSIRELGKSLKLNHSTIVNCYNKLEQSGLITKKEGSGCYVTYGQQKFISDEFDFSGRNSNIDIFPEKDITDSIQWAMNEYGAQVFTYEKSEGFAPLLESLESYLREFNIKCPRSLIQIVSGGQQAIDIISKSLIHFGDSIITEQPTYNGALESFKSRDARIIQIPLREDGIDIKKLENRIKIETPSFIYLMSYYQKPTGISYSLSVKKELISLSEKYNFYIVEDDLGSEISLNNNDYVTLKSLDRFDRVIYIKSFSPLFMPGLRLGFMALPTSIHRKLKKIKKSTDISTPGIIQRGFSHYLNSYDWKEYYNTIKKHYIDKIKIVNRILTSEFSELLDFKIYNNSPIYWLRLKKGDSLTLKSLLQKDKLKINPGTEIDIEYIDWFSISIKSIPLSKVEMGMNILKKGISKLYEMEL